jgi:hypothetical protein
MCYPMLREINCLKAKQKTLKCYTSQKSLIFHIFKENLKNEQLKLPFVA